MGGCNRRQTKFNNDDPDPPANQGEGEIRDDDKDGKYEDDTNGQTRSQGNFNGAGDDVHSNEGC